MRRHTEKYDIGLPNRGEVAGSPRFHFEVAVGADDTQPALLHRPKVWTARKEDDVRPRLREPGADVSADGSRADDDEFHDAFAKAFATTPRWILPVAVRGMVSVM